jgi:hypothetical protein
MVTGMGLFVTGALAQHEGHHADGGSTPAAAPKSADMMCDKMKAEANETGKLADQLVKDFAALQAEKDPAALQQKLVAHGALLKELQAKIDAHSKMMGGGMKMMSGMKMDGQAADGEHNH